MKKWLNVKTLGAVFVTIFFVWCAAIVSSVPDEIILFQDEKLNIGKFFTVEAKTDSLGVLRGKMMDNSENSYFAEVKLCGVVPIKTVKVNVSEAPKVVPCGKSIGVKLYTDGLLVVGISNFAKADGHMVSPARDAGIRQGDIVEKVNGKSVSKAYEFSEYVQDGDGNAVTVTVKREGATYKYSITPCRDDNGDLKLGMWVRSSVAGIGTMTFYNPETKTYGALGHGIADSDTGDIVPIGKGEVLGAEIISVVRGERGSPGELRGSFSNDEHIGNVEKNTQCGIYGRVSDENFFDGQAVEVASRAEVKEGPAKILSCVDGEEVKNYDIEIQRVSERKYVETKCMIIKVTDPELLNQTGGILQGMSGSPIIQNGKLIGAVTHVFVNDPTRGYGIFIENMLAEAEKIK